MIVVPNFIGEPLTPDQGGAGEAREVAGRLVAALPAAPTP